MTHAVENTPHSLALGDYDVLPLDVMLIDTSYQRELRERVVKEMLAEGYDMDAAGAILISERPPLRGMSDPRYYIVDGQHRRAVAKRSGETEHIVKIVRFKGSEAKIRQLEAELRGKMGYRKADTPVERFKHQLAAGQDQALAIDSLVESHGGTIAVVSNGKGINAVSTLEKLYGRTFHKRPLLGEVLGVIVAGWGTLEGRAGETAALEGVGWLISKHGDALDRKHLVRRLKSTAPEAIHSRAVAMRAVMGGALWKNYYRAIVEAYNTRQPDAKKLPVVEL